MLVSSPQLAQAYQQLLPSATFSRTGTHGCAGKWERVGIQLKFVSIANSNKFPSQDTHVFLIFFHLKQVC
jgi:hypothetical protein